MTTNNHQAEQDARAKHMRPGYGSVSAWAEATLQFSDRYSKVQPGKFSLDRMPYLREVIDCSTNPKVHELVLCFAVQSGKSTALQVMLAHRVAERPTASMMVLPSLKLARSISQEKWLELVKCNPCLTAKMPPDRDLIKLDEQRFTNATVWWVGAGSDANLSSRSAGLVFADEIDKFPDWGEKEAPPLQLVGARMESFADWLFVMASTPTLDRGVNVWTEYKRGDQRVYMVPCPFCKHHIELGWEGIKYDETAFDAETATWDFDRVAESTRYECPGCRELIGHEHKAAMLTAGHWKPTALGEPGRRSYHLNSLYSPFKRWGDLATRFLQDRDSPRGLHYFVNSYLARPWSPSATTVKASNVDDVITSSPEYIIGEIPREPDAMFMTVDVQQTELWWLIRASGIVNGKRWSAMVDYGSCVGWDAILAKFNEKYPVKDCPGKLIQCHGGLVDSGYAARRTGGVYEFVLNSGGKFWASKGRGASTGMRASVIRQVIEHRGRAVRLVQYDDNVWKERLYINKIKDRDTKDWWLPRNTGRDYIAQLTAERLVERRMKFGHKELAWEVVGGNHLGDTEKMSLIMIETMIRDAEPLPAQPVPVPA
jgi:phage terminase large subunit GpA-like protein